MFNERCPKGRGALRGSVLMESALRKGVLTGEVSYVLIGGVLMGSVLREGLS